ncbi:hypothetical protein Glove_273g20 [Diversispora epigaea]|uniref:Uncharacterized protein n=1 Tax=Diversispora epigaea TaxID=1348612 RepID=A0A397I3N8_9GLOM|nr:hypothetical protein Glove_273g20 [Diversispora epigaea]
MLQLSTLKRRLKTLLNDFERARKIWDELNDYGLTFANSLVNLKFQERKVKLPTYSTTTIITTTHSTISNDEFSNLKEKKITDLSQSFNLILEKMILQYTKMKMQIMQMEFLLEEACESLGDEFVYNTPLYLTCTLEVFVHNSINIFNMFTKEIDLKLKIGNSIQQTIINIEYEQTIVLLSTWLNQPYVDNNKIKEFENICEIELIE